MKNRIRLYLIVGFFIWGIRLSYYFQLYIDGILMILLSLIIYANKLDENG
jgi:hypothetical protein